MFGWSISARACRSASNRASTGLRVHAGLDELHRDGPLDRLGLLGHEDAAHAALADLLDQLVLARENRADFFGVGRTIGRRRGPTGTLPCTRARALGSRQPVPWLRATARPAAACCHARHRLWQDTQAVPRGAMQQRRNIPLRRGSSRLRGAPRNTRTPNTSSYLALSSIFQESITAPVVRQRATGERIYSSASVIDDIPMAPPRRGYTSGRKRANGAERRRGRSAAIQWLSLTA